MRKKDDGVTIGIPGAASLMVIFAVLCMAVFSVLALSTALADARLSDSSAEAVRSYYEADAAAEERLAQLRREGTEGMEEYAVPFSDTRQLQVEVRLDGSDYEILKWQSVYSADWNADESLNVWDGD